MGAGEAPVQLVQKPALGPASITHAKAPRKGGVTNEAITRLRISRGPGRSVRAVSQAIGAPMASDEEPGPEGQHHGVPQGPAEPRVGEHAGVVGEGGPALAAHAHVGEPPERQEDEQEQCSGGEQPHGDGAVESLMREGVAVPVLSSAMAGNATITDADPGPGQFASAYRLSPRLAAGLLSSNCHVASALAAPTPAVPRPVPWTALAPRTSLVRVPVPR